jgi:5-aminopentanamidase
MDAEPRLRVAVAGPVTSTCDGEVILAVVEAAAERATAAGAALLVLPQGFLTGGPAGGAASAEASAILSDGPAARALGAIARRRRLAVVCGYVERCSGHNHDAALFVDDAGCALANYRRTHLLPDDEALGLAQGHWMNLVAFGGCKLGLLLGADIEAPEPARALALAGAAVLLVPAAHGAAAAPVLATLLATRAFENGCAVAYANGHRDTAAPGSCIHGPGGELLAGDGASFAVADVPLVQPDTAARRLAARRPQLYQKLTAAPSQPDVPRP